MNEARRNALLHAFLTQPQLQSRVLTVLTRLPETIKADFGDDPLFQITLEDYSPEQGWRLFMAWPATVNSVSRCVVLRRGLEHATDEFAL